MKKQIVWAVLRDGEPYVYRATKKAAELCAGQYRPGSKHKWTVQEYRITRKP